MTGCGIGRRVVRAMAVALFAGLLCSGSAVAQVTASEAERRVEAAYGVDVLDVREGEIDGRAVWLVTVMMPAGDSNAAFMVSRLAVDRQSGDLVSAFRHGVSGTGLPSGRRDDRVGVRPDAMRSRTWR